MSDHIDQDCGMYGAVTDARAIAPKAVCSTALLEWLRGKLADAERALAARQQAAACWKSGTNATWEAAAKVHPATANEPPLNKAARMDLARREERIAARCRRDVANYKAVIAALSHSNSLLNKPGSDKWANEFKRIKP